MSRGDADFGFCRRMTIARDQNARLSTMKTLLHGRHLPLFPSAPVLLFLLATLLAPPLRAADEVTTALQQGLFEEEANQNLAAAIKAYQAVLERHDEQRKLASTALFRLGECYRKLGRTNDAVTQYQRLLRDYSDQTTLVTLSKQNLAGLAARMAEAPSISSGAKTSAPLDPRQRSLFLEGIKLAQRQLAEAKEKSRVGVISPISEARYEREVLRLKRELNLADEGPASALARKLLDEEIKLQEKVVEEVQARLRNGKAMLGEEIDAQRELLALKREQVSLDSAMTASPAPSLQQTFDQRLKAMTDAAATSEEDNEVRRIQALIKDSPDLINARRGNETPLLKAARAGQLVVARFLLENKADPNLGDENGTTPLISAASAGHRGMCDLLLKNGADPDRKTLASRTALHGAAYQGYRSVVEVLLEQKANVNAQDEYGGSPLCDASARGFLSIAQLLLERGANPNLARTRDPNQASFTGYDKDFNSGAPLHFAVQRGNQPLLELLLTNKADVNLRRSYGSFSTLDLAVSLGDTNLSLLLIKAGAEVNTAPSEGFAEGWTPLIRAAHRTDARMVALLLARGANPNARQRSDFNGGDRLFTPLHIMTFNQDKARAAVIAEMLLKAKADPNLKTEKGWTPLHLAIPNGQPALVDILLRHGADLTMLTPTGYTPLTQAAWQKDGRDLAELLLKAKADPNARDTDGLTPLHYAAGYQRKETLELLLASGTNPNLTDPQGRTALDYVKQGVNLDRSVPGNPSIPRALPPPQPGLYGGTAPAPVLTGERADMAGVLRKSGAIEWAPRPNQITLFRRSTGAMEIPFLKDKDARNRFSLFEVIATIGFGSGTRFPFPDLTNVTITRIEAGSGALTNFTVNVAGRVASADCRQNMWLEWGDLIEVPELEHKLTDRWNAPPTEFIRAVTNCLPRSFTITVKGKPTKATWYPSVVIGVVNSASGVPGGQIPVAFKGMNFRLFQVVQDSGLLLTSSDTSRVKVKRTDPDTGEVREWTYNVEKDAGPNDLWLRDGDEIEVPEK